MQLSQQENANKILIQQMFQDIIEGEEFDEQQIARYFSPSYEQKADGKTLDYRSFLDHVRELKRTVTGLQVTVEYIVAEGNKVLDIHRVEAEKRTGGKVEARVFSLWVIEDGWIVLCDELTHLERGAAEDRDLGSRTSRP
jgi:ketosteroid isomerase-like protein